MLGRCCQCWRWTCLLLQLHFCSSVSLHLVPCTACACTCHRYHRFHATQVEKNTTLTISGYNKVQIGDFAATVRRQRPPEPYKGKGIRFQGEVIKLKEGEWQ